MVCYVSSQLKKREGSEELELVVDEALEVKKIENDVEVDVLRPENWFVLSLSVRGPVLCCCRRRTRVRFLRKAPQRMIEGGCARNKLFLARVCRGGEGSAVASV